MKIDKSNFTVVLMANENSYEGSFDYYFKEKIFNKEVLISDTAFISSDKDAGRDLNNNEKTLMNQINKLVLKELDKRGFKFEKWVLSASSDAGDIDVEYSINNGNSYNTIGLSLLEDNTLSKKALSLSRSLSKRLLRELK